MLRVWCEVYDALYIEIRNPVSFLLNLFICCQFIADAVVWFYSEKGVNFKQISYFPG